MVVGTKSDLILSREISYDEGQSIARSIGAVYVETSSVNNENFKKVLTIIL